MRPADLTLNLETERNSDPPRDRLFTISTGMAVLAVVLGLLAGQRFLMPPVSAFICLVPVALALLFWRDAALRNAMVCLALLSKVDSSDIAYMDTPGIVRLFIYAMAIGVLFAGFRISSRRLAALSVYVIILLVMTFTAGGIIDNYSLVRDVITLVGILAVLGASSSPGDPLVVNMRVVAFFSAGLLFAELVNLRFFYDISTRDYLSYDSLKGAVMVASLYLLAGGRLLTFVPLFAGTMLVIIGYATRMLLVTYLGLIVLLFFGKSISGTAKIGIIVFFAAVVVTAAVSLPTEVLEGQRLFGFLFAHESAGGVLDFLRVLDPVRYVEHEMFFQRPWYEAPFGSGLGSGLIDTTGQLSFVQPNTGAFTDKELLESRYFRLHDPWIYFGLRLGLVFVLVAYGYFIRATLNRSPDIVVLGGFGLILFNAATFSISGLLMTALVAKQIALVFQGNSRGGRP
jgi:hypothetical protein